MDVASAARAAKKASIPLAAADSETKDRVLAAIADALTARSAEIAAANAQDLRLAVETHLAEPLLKRLRFDEKKIGYKSFTDFVKAQAAVAELQEDGQARRVRLKDRG